MEHSFKDDIKILCVEDDITNQTVLKMLLLRIGYKNVSIAGSGQEALKLLAQSRIHLILMDLGLPDISGIEVTQIIRATDWPAQNSLLLR